MVVASASLDEPVQVDAPTAPPPWRPLGYFNLYRTTLAAMLLVLVMWGGAPRPLGTFDPALFQGTAIAYLLFGLLSTATAWRRWPRFHLQVVTQVCVDIAALTLLMHASGGVSSGLGLLLVVAIAGGSILAHGRIAVLFAALASLAVLAQQIVVWLNSPFPSTSYPHAGILGAAFFATAYLAWLSAQRLRASEALAARRASDLENLSLLNQHIVERMQSGILVVEPGGRVRLANKSAQRLLGLAERPHGRRLASAVPEVAELLERWRGDTSRPTHLLRVIHGQLQVQVSFASLGAGGAEGSLVFLEDASAMNQRAQELKLASLGRLSASIAHEIRNPLSAISHAGQLLAESSNLDRADQRLTRIIRDNSLRMNHVIENVLQLGRGRPAEPLSLELGPWLEDFIEEFTHDEAGHSRAVRLEVSPSDLRVRADPTQLRQVLWNLCENAVQHSPEDSAVELTAGISRENRRPYLDIRDHGEGIDPVQLEHIFEPFFTSRAEGTGLGLYIARELCAGNQASLNHVPTQAGSCFKITFSDPRRQRAVVA